GTKYYYGPGELDRRTQKTKFGPFYVYNKQGAIKHDNAATPILDEGYGFSIDCNSHDEEILIWNEIEVSSTGFTIAH
ncbi:phage tail protein, partial [Salmonella enterica subsp. enterica serovar Kentucky]|nr:phage tail protein [Salmonella enterica subsp. enterica serovar Kentucky]